MHIPALQGNFIETFLAGENTMAKSRHEKEAEKQTEIIEAFNKAHPIGTIVDVTKDDYSIDRT